MTANVGKKSTPSHFAHSWGNCDACDLKDVSDKEDLMRQVIFPGENQKRWQVDVHPPNCSIIGSTHFQTIPNMEGGSQMLHDITKQSRNRRGTMHNSSFVRPKLGMISRPSSREMDNLRITLLHPAAWMRSLAISRVSYVTSPPLLSTAYGAIWSAWGL